MFKDKLKQLRTERNLTQADVAKGIGVSAATIGNYEQGTREPRNNEAWQRLADFFNVTVDELMDKEKKKRFRIIKPEEDVLIESYCKFRTDKPIIYHGVDVTKSALAGNKTYAIPENLDKISVQFSIYSSHAMYARSQLLEIIFNLKKKTKNEISENLKQITSKIQDNVIYWYKRCWNNISDIFEDVTDLTSLYEQLLTCLMLDDAAAQEFGFIKLPLDFDWLREKLHS